MEHRCPLYCLPGVVLVIGVVHVHVGKPQIVELLIQLFFTVNSVSYGVNPLLSERHPPVLLSGLHPTPCAGPTAIP